MIRSEHSSRSIFFYLSLIGIFTPNTYSKYLLYSKMIWKFYSFLFIHFELFAANNEVNAPEKMDVSTPVTYLSVTFFIYIKFIPNTTTTYFYKFLFMLLKHVLVTNFKAISFYIFLIYVTHTCIGYQFQGNIARAWRWWYNCC